LVDIVVVYEAQAFDVPVVVLFNPAAYPFWQLLPGPGL